MASPLTLFTYALYSIIQVCFSVITCTCVCLTYYVVMYGFEPNSAYPYLTLRFGDVVHILEENGGWYRGFSLHDKHSKGIFPASHITIKECSIVNSG